MSGGKSLSEVEMPTGALIELLRMDAGPLLEQLGLRGCRVSIDAVDIRGLGESHPHWVHDIRIDKSGVA